MKESGVDVKHVEQVHSTGALLNKPASDGMHYYMFTLLDPLCELSIWCWMSFVLEILPARKTCIFTVFFFFYSQ